MTALRFFERKSFVCVAMAVCFVARINRAEAEDVVTQPIRVFTGHTYFVGSVAFSPNGRYVLAGSDDNTAKLWDIVTGECIRTFTPSSIGCSPVFSVAFSPDGKCIITGGGADYTAKLWDVTTGSYIRTFIGHRGQVTSVAFSSDGTKVLTGSHDGTAKLWDTSTGICTRTFGHAWDVRSVAFSPDGNRVLIGGEEDAANGTAATAAKLWNATTGSCLRNFIVTGIVFSVSFSPDGTWVLTASYDCTINLGTVKLWDIATGACIRTFVGGYTYVKSVAFSPNGMYVLTGGDQVKLWDVATGACIRTFYITDSVGSVAFSPNGAYFVTGGGTGYNGIVKLWRTDASPPRPTVSAVEPAMPVATGAPQSFAICGANFDQNASVTLRCISSGEVFPNRTISSRSDTRITINPNFGNAAGKWSVEVINPGPVSSGEFNFSVKQGDVSVGSVAGDLQLRLPFPDGAEYQVTQGYVGISHTGYQVDFGTGLGKPVVAVAKGTVFAVGDYSGNCWPPNGPCPSENAKAGLYVKLKHPGRTSFWYSDYFHLSRQAVKLNDPVEQGQIIGYTGNTGYSSAAHLHFEMRNSADVGVRPVPMNGIVVSAGVATITDFVEGERYRAFSSAVQNGSFADGLLDYWTTGGTGDIEVVEDSTLPGRCWARFLVHSTVALSQVVSTPLDRFEVSFDYRFNTTSGFLSVVLDSVVLGTIEAPATLSGNFATTKFVVIDPSLRNLQNAVLEFQFSGPAGSEILAGNIMLSPMHLSGDANNDCKVDILDLIFIRNRLNQDVSTGDNINADVNQDGKINILDLIFVRSKLGTKCSQ